ncbi:glycoside hydrolase family 95 protein [Daejeonella lutea]|uniref:Alpha-L-fucosidase 2 n=1 Tax=Daejeonella lutea TaxID=572036 RepID=A0A1T5DWT3_9SPHI|nr:glycoside hydrolase N-terminal domain-containing protein [Daejeonella lutea]SKB76095.1 alpha-L-fucosidase 2 [Daejeonella lutea]
MIKKFAFYLLITSAPFVSKSQEKDLKLWYQQPATTWVEALPVGNGRMGAMVFGNVQYERIQLNEESIWAGKKISIDNPGSASHLKEIQQLLLNGENAKAHELSTKFMLAIPNRFRSHQTLGDIFIDFGLQGSPKEYERNLDLSTGVATTTYVIDGIKFKREVFASGPHDCIVVRITSDKPNSINCKINLSRERDATVNSYGQNSLLMNGQIVDVDDSNGEGGLNMKFGAILKASSADGTIQSANNSILVKSASNLTILLTSASDYSLPKLDFDRSIDVKAACDKIIANASAKQYEEIKKSSVDKHRELFDRVTLDLGGNDLSRIPTDKRLNAVKNGSADPQLIQLYFQYGRYLLIASSTSPGVLPANLQGVWNDHYDAPWDSDYHTNINLQMNYWPSEVTNLSETNESLFNFIDAYRLPGRETAKGMYNAKGWTMHHATDIFGKTGINAAIQYGVSPLAAAWLTLHLWEHYQFTGDKKFLKERAYPIMKEAAEFVQTFLIEDKHGRLVTAPSMSPENAFKLANGEKHQITYAPTIDIEIIMALYNACIESAEILKSDQHFAAGLKKTLTRLPAIKVSPKTGGIQEWIEDYDEAEPGHRHISHLLALYPADLITPDQPELFAAAAKTLERRLANGGGHTGWSRAWIINFYARLLDGEKAYENVVALLQKSTLSNLFDNHPPFQIDGNFGGTAGIAEMMIQSHQDYIKLLPAMPQVWANGSVKGLCARGGFEVNMKWQNGKVSECSVTSKQGNRLKINVNGKAIDLRTKAGQTYKLL